MNDSTIQNGAELTDDFLLSLEIVAKTAYKDAVLAERYLNSITFPSSLVYLKDALFTHVWWARHCDGENEKHMQKRFYHSLHTILPGAKIVSVKEDARHKPDGWVDIGGVLHVVEMKLDVFNKSALRQIKRYMNFYKVGNGIAVAPRLACRLPANIMFLSFTKNGITTNSAKYAKGGVQ